MGDLSEAINVFSSPTGGQNMTTMGTPKTRKNRSAVWNDFTLDPESEKIAICDHCGKKLKYNGTSSMTTHLKGCKNNPNSESNKRQRNNSSSINVEGQVISSPLVPSFDQEKLRYSCIKGLRKSSIIESLIIEDYKELEKLEQEIAAMKVGDACSASVALDED
ncbi:hypothetical protein P8452_32011 [Trifolium repens]|nr:hypothetical protein P8452_32011 [Trifolium repens]